MSDIIYLARHGQTDDNLADKLGGDSSLTETGKAHARLLAVEMQDQGIKNIYHSFLARSRETAEIIKDELRQQLGISPYLFPTSCLREIKHGDFDQLTYSQLKEEYPEMAQAREKDKWGWSFPNGESYATMTERITPFFNFFKEKELDKKDSSLIVGHQGVNRAILGYLLKLNPAEIPNLKIPHEAIFAINLQEPEKTGYILRQQEHSGYIIA